MDTNLPPEPDEDGLEDAVTRAVFSQAPVGLHVFDPDLRLVRVNSAATRIRDFPVHRMIGSSLRELLDAFAADDPAGPERTVRQVLATGKPVRDLVVRVRTRTDPPVEAVASASVFRLEDADGRVLGVVSAITDITARARAEAGLRLLNQGASLVGTTLDVFRTAEEFCRHAVPAFADTVVVDVFDAVLRGQAPTAAAVEAGAALRRAGFLSRAGDGVQGVPVVGELTDYRHGTPFRDSLATMAPQLIRRLHPDASWLDATRTRHARIVAAGVHSMIVVPVRARGVVLGLATFYRWSNPVAFDRQDRLLAEQLTAHAALSLDNARLYSRERSVARIVRRGLRPTAASTTSAVELAHVYLPAGAGGGWFDVIPLSGARIALVAGDTLADSAGTPVATGELRAVIEALSDLDLPPDELLERVHDLAADSDLAGGATCLYLDYDPVTRICAAASAGHPVPLLAHRDGTVEPLDVVIGPPLGKGLAQYRSTARALPEGSLLLLRNEALRPGPAADPSGEELQDRVGRALADAPADLQRACDAVAEALTPLQPAHDAYLLMARTRAFGTDRTRTWSLPNGPEMVGRARRLAVRQIADWGLEPEVGDNTALIVSELVTNAVRYAEGPIQLRLIHADGGLICEVTDDSSTAPHLRRALDTDEHGRGLFITAQLTQRWGVRNVGRGKTIWAEQALSE